MEQWRLTLPLWYPSDPQSGSPGSSYVTESAGRAYVALTYANSYGFGAIAQIDVVNGTVRQVANLTAMADSNDLAGGASGQCFSVSTDDPNVVFVGNGTGGGSLIEGTWPGLPSCTLRR